MVVPTAADIQAMIDGASSGDVIVIPPGVTAPVGGFIINTPGITIMLSDGTIIQASSPCFTVAANNVTITSATIGGGKCIPSGGASGIVVDTAVNNLVISGIEFDGTGQSTASGIWINKAVNNLQILNNFMHNLGADGITYTATGVVTGVHEVQGNLFQNNTGLGVNNLSVPTYDVKYNSWGDIAGPTGTNGDGVSTKLVYDPWTHVGLSMVSSGSPVANKVGVGEQITYTIKMDAANVFGAVFDLNYDSSKLSVVSATNGGSFSQDYLCTLDTATPGVVSFCGHSDTAVNGTPTVYTVVFEGVASGLVPLNLDETNDLFAMAPPSGASNNIYAAALTDGSVTVLASTTVSGRVDLQGRPNDSGALMTLTVSPGPGSGPYAFAASDYWGSISQSGVITDTYAITVSMPRYLAMTVASAKLVTISADKVLTTLTLFGGDANDSGNIDVSDAAIIGGQYGKSGAGITDIRADINNDGIVDIFDIVLMGGNFGFNSASAYSSWTP